MSKYDIGDEFVIRIGDIFNNYVQGSVNKLNHLYKIDGFNSLVFDDNGLDKLQKVEVAEELAIPYNEAYNKGLEDAWKFIIKMHDMTLEELKLIFW